MWNSHKNFVLAAALLAVTATQSYAGEAELLEVLRSDATLEEKSAACRQLARVGTKESVPTLAGLLDDEKLSHMARYALEPIRDPSVDEALREALGKLQGRTLLGVIGSLGVRRDAKAVDALAGLLEKGDTAEAAARALGTIGTAGAAKALEDALPDASDAKQMAVSEGLLRCAEALAEEGDRSASKAIYDRLRDDPDAPPQVRAAGLRGAILTRGEEGVPLLVEAIHGSDYAMAAAAIRTAMEMPGAEITDALLNELTRAPAERKGLLIAALARRGEARVLPTVLEVAKNAEGQLRILAFRALKRVGDVSCLPALLDAAAEGDSEISQAAMESLETLQAESVDEQLVMRLSEAEGKMRLLLIDLVGRRRTVAAAPALWRAADDDDPAIRAAALAALGSAIEPADLPKLIARLGTNQDDREAAALDKALRDVSQRAEDRDAVAAQLAAALPEVDASVKGRILDVLNVVGGAKALETLAAATRSGNEAIRDEAFRVLGQWRSADAAPVLLELHNAVDEEKFKIRAIRGYIRIIRQFDMPAAERAEMCRTALRTARRDADKQLVLEVLLRYPSDEMQAIALEAADNPALKEQALLVVMGMAGKGINRDELGRALAQAGQTPVDLEIVTAEYGAEGKVKDVTATLKKYAKNYRIIFLPSTSYNESFGGDPARGIRKELKIQYRINGKESEVTLGENATIVLPEITRLSP